MNRIKTMTYDAVNNLVSVQYADGSAVTNLYDALYRVTYMADATGITTNAYSQRNELLGRTVPNGSLAYQYDPVGNRTTMIDMVAGVYAYGYDTVNRLTTIINPFSEITSATYDALNRESTKTLANGNTVSHVYDAAGRQTFLGNFDASSTPLACYTATFDNVGNQLTSLGADGSFVNYIYDAANQLTSESRTGTFPFDTQYIYDLDGNRAVRIDSGLMTAYQYDQADQLIVVTPPSGPSTTNTFDACGNMTVNNVAGAITTYGWDCENRMIVATPPAVVNPPTTMQYGADGLMRVLNSGGVPISILWDGQNQLQLVANNGGSIISFRNTDYPGYWGGLVSYRVEEFGTLQFSQFLGFDQSMNTRVQTDAGGNIQAAPVYHGFGIELTGNAPQNSYAGQVGVLFINPSNTGFGLYSMRHRIMDPDTGRFLSRDPARMHGGRNRYPYAKNRPTTLVNPSGKSPTVRGECIIREWDNIDAALAIACNAINSAAGQACIGKLSPGYKNCINSFCGPDNDTEIYCGNQICGQHVYTDCVMGNTQPPGLWNPCQIFICTKTIGHRSCWPKGVTSVEQMIALTILHEAMHCCGMGDKGGDDPYNPAEDVARCIMGIPGHIRCY